VDAYLGIETTGLYSCFHKITVVGLSFGDDPEVIQWVGNGITSCGLLQALEPASTIYTYNGSRFDRPFLNACLGIDLRAMFEHRDLMLDCWQNSLYGGLKAVERRLGIPRRLKDIDGLDAVRLWNKYEKHSDHRALRVLLDYNKEDVLNLKALKGILL